jgi:hypothetical protein
MTSTHAHNAPATIVVIPCAAAKHDAPAPAAALYNSANFAHTLHAAMGEAADTERVLGTPTRVMILSALHGLLELDTVVAPYDTKMGDAGCIGAAALQAQLEQLDATTIVSMLPGAYYRALRAAVDAGNDAGTTDIDLMNAYEDAPGIGYQRGVAGSLTRTHGVLAPL